MKTLCICMYRQQFTNSLKVCAFDTVLFFLVLPLSLAPPLFILVWCEEKVGEWREDNREVAQSSSFCLFVLFFSLSVVGVFC